MKELTFEENAAAVARIALDAEEAVERTLAELRHQLRLIRHGLVVGFVEEPRA
jgi:hypothetical protein